MSSFVCIDCFKELKVGEGFTYCKDCEEKIMETDYHINKNEDAKILYHWLSTEELYVMRNRLSELLDQENNKYIIMILKQQLTNVNKEYFSRKL